MPNKIEAIILLDTRKAGAYVVTEKLKDIIDSHPNFCMPIRKSIIVKSLDDVLSNIKQFAPCAMSFPSGAKINVSNNRYANKSPLLGLIGEYLAFGEKPEHKQLVELYINLYFLVSEKFRHTDIDYGNWLVGKHKKILGIYQSSIENAARYLRANIKVNDGVLSNSLIKEFFSKNVSSIPEEMKPLRCLKLYSDGVAPKPKSNSATRIVKPIYIKGEIFSSHLLIHQEHDDIEVEQKLVGQEVANAIKTQKDFIKNYNKMKGRASRLNRQNQLRALDSGFLRPAVWKHLDALILDEGVDLSIRAIICLSLLCGRSIDYCKANIKKILSKPKFIRIELNAPLVKSTGSLPVDNKIYFSVPKRYSNILSIRLSKINSLKVASAKSAIKNMNEHLDISPQKIARLFFFIANARKDRSHAALLFDSPLTTIATQLHYTVTQKSELSSLYVAVFDEYEAYLEPQGMKLIVQPGLCGVMNFPRPIEVQKFILPGDDFDGVKKPFIRFSAENGSRSVALQSADYCSSVDQQHIIAVVNDKKRNGAQQARLSVFSKKILSQICKDARVLHMTPAYIKFEYLTPKGYQVLSPRVFKSMKNSSLKMNAIRKIRRSFLLNMGLSEEIIDALYGHHYVGTVPISHQSSLSIIDIHYLSGDYISLFNTLIERLINE